MPGIAGHRGVAIQEMPAGHGQAPRICLGGG